MGSDARRKGLMGKRVPARKRREKTRQRTRELRALVTKKTGTVNARCVSSNRKKTSSKEKNMLSQQEAYIKREMIKRGKKRDMRRSRTVRVDGPYRKKNSRSQRSGRVLYRKRSGERWAQGIGNLEERKNPKKGGKRKLPQKCLDSANV